MHDWLDHHLETFVKPYLGSIPEVNPKEYWITILKSSKVKAIQACWKEAKKKAKGRIILLPGRDVYLFEVLARLEDWHTIFRPDISSCVAPYIKDDYTECYCLDTGYKGSIPKALKIKNFGLILYAPYPIVPGDKDKYQLFPLVKRGPISTLTGTLESTHKYWERATVVGPDPNGKVEIIQKLSTVAEFRTAAMITRYLASFVPKRYHVRSVGRGV